MTAPMTARQSLGGLTYVINLDRCREALVQQEARLYAQASYAGERRTPRQLVCEAAGVDPKTLKRFLDGQRVTIPSFYSIVIRGLGLRLDEVATRVREREAQSA